MHDIDWFKNRIGKTIKRIRMEQGERIVSYQHIKNELSAELAFMKQDKDNVFVDNEPKRHRYGNYRRTFEQDGVIYTK